MPAKKKKKTEKKITINEKDLMFGFTPAQTKKGKTRKKKK